MYNTRIPSTWMLQHWDPSIRDTFIRNIRIRGFLRCKLCLRDTEQIEDWFSPKDAFQHRHGMLAKMRRTRGEPKELGIFFYFHGDLACREQGFPRLLTSAEHPSTRIPVVHWGALPCSLSCSSSSAANGLGKHSVRNGRGPLLLLLCHSRFTWMRLDAIF